MPSIRSDTIKTVAIIGAGPSGLATAKYLLAENVFTHVVLYEQRSNVGGVWNYTPHPPNPPSAITNRVDSAVQEVTADLPNLDTPMYDHLETNLPHMLMQFSDTPFPAGTQLFPSRETVLEYLENYAQDIASLVRFHHEVIDVKPKGCGQSHGWEVTVKNKIEEELKVENFDAVVAANGHCDWPLLPEIQGLDAWSKQFPQSLHHSVSYKNAELFTDKRVLLVGGGPSGADIGGQIAAKCRHPLLVAQNSKSPYHTDESYTCDYPFLVELIPDERAARFADGNVETDIDHVVLCTGYAYRFPFLTSFCPEIESEGVQALPLYEHVFHTLHPTLAFVEVPEMIVPFPLAESQAAVIARVWSGRLDLPDHDHMERWRANLVRDRGVGRAFHALKPPVDLEYMTAMYEWSSLAEGERIPDGTCKGKMPRMWDSKSCWLRMMAAEMKKAFNAKGNQRSDVRSYEELEFQYGNDADTCP